MTGDLFDPSAQAQLRTLGRFVRLGSFLAPDGAPSSRLAARTSTDAVEAA